MQERIIEFERYCRLLDLKKLPDFNHYESAERLYKVISKGMSKGSEVGPRLGKLFSPGTEEKLIEIQSNLNRIEDNISIILT